MIRRHYQELLQGLSEGKDADFEPCVIVEYDAKTLLAKIFGLNSKQHRSNVPVLFAANHLNSGVIAPPPKNATGMLFWGADNQPFVFPAYYLPIVYHDADGNYKPSASPSRFDPTLGYDHVEGGEVYLSSLSGAFLHAKNTDEVEMGTSKLHRFWMSGTDGSLRAITEQADLQVGGLHAVAAPVGDGDFHVKYTMNDVMPSQFSDIGDDQLLAQILDGTFDESFTDADPLFEMQMGNVTDAAGMKIPASDGAELFARCILYSKADNSKALSTFGLSKSGQAEWIVQDDRYISTFTFTAKGLRILSVDTEDDDPETNTRTHTLGFA